MRTKSSAKFVKEPHPDFKCEVTLTSTIIGQRQYKEIRNAFEASLTSFFVDYDLELTELGDHARQIFGDLILTTETFIFEANLKDLSVKAKEEAGN